MARLAIKPLWILLLLLFVCSPAAVSAQNEMAELDSMEKEWASSIDKAVSCMREKDRMGAGVYIRKANSIIERMKELLIRKGYVTDSADRMVAMDKLTDAYKNMAKIVDYVVDAPSLIMNAGRVQTIISDTREKLLDAYVRFYEVVPLQKLCKQFIEVLDRLEMEMQKVLSRVAR
jgi:uncharacterized protein YktA (UPF0223 family)